MEEKILTKKLEKLIETYFPEDDIKGSEKDSKVEDILLWAQCNCCHILDLSEPGFRLLREISRQPELLFMVGDVKALDRELITMVGTRRPGHYGLRAAHQLASALCRSGFGIVSGLARGIDSAAHKGALHSEGITIAVLAHGLDIIYPRENLSLANRIVEKGGLLLSEYPPGVRPRKHHFPERNRILAGLSLGTVVVEAPRKSGSLITAMFALEQNREVFAIPGIFDDSHFSGNHWLIQQGAKLVCSMGDIEEEFHGWANIKEGELELDCEPLKKLRDLFAGTDGSASLEELLPRFQADLGELMGTLKKAEQEGKVLEIAHQRYVLLVPRL